MARYAEAGEGYRALSQCISCSGDLSTYIRICIFRVLAPVLFIDERLRIEIQPGEPENCDRRP